MSESGSEPERTLLDQRPLKRVSTPAEGRVNGL